MIQTSDFDRRVPPPENVKFEHSLWDFLKVTSIVSNLSIGVTKSHRLDEDGSEEFRIDGFRGDEFSYGLEDPVVSAEAVCHVESVGMKV
jgi:hypothetical protein